MPSRHGDDTSPERRGDQLVAVATLFFFVFVLGLNLLLCIAGLERIWPSLNSRTAASKPTWLLIGQIEPLLRHYEKGGAGRGIGRDARERRQSAAALRDVLRTAEGRSPFREIAGPHADRQGRL